MTTPIPGFPLLEWCSNPSSATIVEVALNTVRNPDNQLVSVDAFVEPNFPGYRAAGNGAWAVRVLLSDREGFAQSGSLCWVADADNASPPVTGYFVRLTAGGVTQVIFAEDFPVNVNLTTAGASLAFIAFLTTLLFQLTSL